MRPVDLRCSLAGEDAGVRHAAAGFGGHVVAADGFWPALRRPSPAPGPPLRWTAASWSPGELGSTGIDELLAVGPDWHGLVRCDVAACGGPAALSEWAIDDLAAGLSSLRRALLVELGDQPTVELDLVHRLARRHPALAIVVSPGTGFSAHGLLLALVRSTPTVVLETSGLASEVVGVAARELGGHRVAFGSGGPERDLVAELGRVTDAAGAAARDAVVGGTARALLSGAWSV